MLNFHRFLQARELQKNICGLEVRFIMLMNPGFSTVCMGSMSFMVHSLLPSTVPHSCLMAHSSYQGQLLA